MKFETKNARYNLHLACHLEQTKIGKKELEKYDAFVLELACKYDETTFDSIKNLYPYKEIASKIIEAKKPAFLTDLGARFSEENDSICYHAIDCSERIIPFFAGFSAPPASLLLTLPFISNTSSLIGYFIEPFAEINTYLSISNFYTPTGLRSAISAKKIEDYISPGIKKELGYTPKIFIEFGVGHSDMKQYLKHKRIRESVIKLHKLWDYYPLDKRQLKLIKEFNFDGNPLNLGEVVSNHDHSDGHKEIIYKID